MEYKFTAGKYTTHAATLCNITHGVNADLKSLWQDFLEEMQSESEIFYLITGILQRFKKKKTTREAQTATAVEFNKKACWTEHKNKQVPVL